MFYGHYVLSKKGPLAKIWLAAHWEKKLTKAAVFDTNIEATVNNILEPKVRMALRTIGHLMLGIVRIYSRKTKYLLADCNEAFLKIKLAFRPGQVDLPEEAREANPNAINLPDVFTDFDSALPDFTDFDQDPGLMSANQVSRREDITMADDIPITMDDDFDMGLESIEMGRAADSTAGTSRLLRSAAADVTLKPDKSKDATLLDAHAPADDDFGGQLDENLLNELDMDNLFGVPDTNEQVDFEPEAESGDERASTGDQGPGSVAPPEPMEEEALSPGGALSSLMPPSPVRTRQQAASEMAATTTSAGQETTLVANEDEAFVLEPLDAGVLAGGYERNKLRRKRKLLVDEVKAISAEEMKSQLNNAADTMTTLHIAPPTKKLMHWHECGFAEKLFANPPTPMQARTLQNFYGKFLVTRAVQDEIEQEDGQDRLQLGDVEEPPATPQPSVAMPSATPVHTAGALLTIPEEIGRDEVSHDVSLAGVSGTHGAGPSGVPDDGLRPPPSVSPADAEPFSPWALGHDEPPIPFTDLEAPPTQGLLMNEEHHVLDEEEEEEGDVTGESRWSRRQEAFLKTIKKHEHHVLDEEEEEEGDVTGESRWSRRQEAFLKTIKKHVRSSLDESASFKTLTKNNSRKLAAQKFYTLLVLKKWNEIDVQQEFAFDDIRITTPNVA